VAPKWATFRRAHDRNERDGEDLQQLLSVTWPNIRRAVLRPAPKLLAADANAMAARILTPNAISRVSIRGPRLQKSNEDGAAAG
jgi:hypothetical protein